MLVQHSQHAWFSPPGSILQAERVLPQWSMNLMSSWKGTGIEASSAEAAKDGGK